MYQDEDEDEEEEVGGDHMTTMISDEQRHHRSSTRGQADTSSMLHHHPESSGLEVRQPDEEVGLSLGLFEAIMIYRIKQHEQGRKLRRVSWASCWHEWRLVAYGNLLVLVLIRLCSQYVEYRQA